MLPDGGCERIQLEVENHVQENDHHLVHHQKRKDHNLYNSDLLFTGWAALTELVVHRVLQVSEEDVAQ